MYIYLVGLHLHHALLLPATICTLASFPALPDLFVFLVGPSSLFVRVYVEYYTYVHDEANKVTTAASSPLIDSLPGVCRRPLSLRRHFYQRPGNHVAS